MIRTKDEEKTKRKERGEKTKQEGKITSIRKNVEVMNRKITRKIEYITEEVDEFRKRKKGCMEERNEFQRRVREKREKDERSKNIILTELNVRKKMAQENAEKFVKEKMVEEYFELMTIKGFPKLVVKFNIFLAPFQMSTKAKNWLRISRKVTTSAW